MDTLEFPNLYTSEIGENMLHLMHNNQKYTNDSHNFL